jgi:hypothetical protein
VLLCELRSIRWINLKSVIVCENAKLNKFNHSCYGFLDNLRNRLKVKDGFREIRIDDRAKAKEDDITEKLLVISRSILNEK